ncbi:MAG: 4Fe-4S dicluster domain-containing protein [Clostridia bacterium]|nr:4Fe-4S dicluster domain-containing protein [Clostridia bacterium]
MPKFDTSVQELKYRVLREVAALTKEDKLTEHMLELPEKIIPGPEPTTRCCIYKERAIVQQRVQMAIGGHEDVKTEVEVLPIACDECPVSQVEVGNACRGCLAHRCAHACPKDAISFENHKATIDHSKCIACGRCVAACPYSAITKNTRPCERACKPGAIKMDENKKAHINEEKCVSCGACVYQCPFGAIVDKSYITHVVKLLNAAKKGGNPVYAVIAPSISGQFEGVTTEQVVGGMKAMGFHNVIEAALGADIVAYLEAQELKEKGFLTSSCCPAFVTYIHKNFPGMVDKISHNLSPMAMIAKLIKKAHPEAEIIFVGPCVAKKGEVKLEKVAPYVRYSITFEELQAMFDAYDIDLKNTEPDMLNNASYFGRIFARSGGLGDAVVEALKEQDEKSEKASDFKLNAVVCNGLEECKVALLKANKGLLQGNFIEGMACEQGCIGGPGCLTHGPKEKAEVDKYGRMAKEQRLDTAMVIYDMLVDE